MTQTHGYTVQYFAFTDVLADSSWSFRVDSDSASPINLYAVNGLAKAPSKFNFDLSMSELSNSVTID